MRLLDQNQLEERAVAVMSPDSRALDTARAFDGVAAAYHQSNLGNPILQHMRDRSIAMLRRHASPGSRVLDLGCGPGTDLLSLVRSGYEVTAIDGSAEMVREAQRVAAMVESAERPAVLQRDIDDVAAFPPGSFDAAFSHFGPLNCVGDLASVASGLQRILRPGGVLVASVIGRICPWEIALYLSRGDVARALIRFSGGHVRVPLQERMVWTRYLSPHGFARTFVGARFTTCELASLGIIAPPPYLEGFAARHPRLTASLLSADARVGGWPVVRQMGDHFLIALRRG